MADGEMGEGMLASVTTTKAVDQGPTEAPVRLRQYSLRDHLTLILVELAGGPVPVRLLLKRLRDEGWKGVSSSVTQALTRNPQLFSNRGHGMYALNLGSSEEGR